MDPSEGAGARWEHFAHVADIGVRGVANSKEEAFVQAAIALTAVVADPSSVRPREAVDLVADGADDELLLVSWLDAVVYAMNTRRMLFSRYEIAFGTGGATGRAWGEPVETARHQPVVEVKAATFAELAVRRLPDGRWLAQCVVDV